MTTNKKNKDQEQIKEAFEKIVSGDTSKMASQNSKAIGVDIGTSKIVIATQKDGKDQFSSQLNSFIAVEYSKFTEGILRQNGINHSIIEDSLIVYGDGAEVFANMLNTETRRPMQKGLLNPKEDKAIEIIKSIINDLTATIKYNDAPLCFSIPGAPQDSPTDIIYHEAIFKRHFNEKGFQSKSINEGLAVIFSELQSDNFTGFGVSAGGGMCNVCLSYLSVPHITFSITKGGDFIDNAVASVTGEVNTRVRSIKETQLNLSKPPTNEIEDALNIYYDDLIMTLVKAMKTAVIQTSKFPKTNAAFPIVLSGGTAKPAGFKERFEQFLKKDRFPIDISEVRVAKDPRNTTAKGALIAAMYER